MARAKAGRQRQRGAVDRLPSGALRVRVYGGTDPISGKRNTLVEIVEPGPRLDARTEAVRTRLLNEVDEQRSPRTSATVDQLLDRYLDTLDVGRTTHRMYTRYLEKHVRPFIGRHKAGAVGAEALDSLYSELRRCRDHCTGKGGVDHRTPLDHACDERCHGHACRPLAPATVRHIHFVLNGAYGKGVRWRWVSVNPVEFVSAPAKPPPDPQPPSAEEAARILNEAFRDPDWGALVWLTMTTGARRGELCALRWSHVDLVSGALTIRRAIAQDGTFREDKDTKTHQQRRLVLDPETVAVLGEHRERCQERANALGLDLPPGRWWGAGAENLGLIGLVDAQDMRAVYERFLDPREDGFSDPARWDEVFTLGHTGRRYATEDELYAKALEQEPDASAERRAELRTEAGRAARHNVAFYDATFRVQKSVTLIHTAFEAKEVAARTAGDEETAAAWGQFRSAVEDAIWAGNNAGLAYLSDKAGYTRIGHHGGAAGRYADAHDWVVASFFQHDSRDRDPQLHIHNTILNRVESPDGTWRTVDEACTGGARPPPRSPSAPPRNGSPTRSGCCWRPARMGSPARSWGCRRRRCR